MGISYGVLYKLFLVIHVANPCDEILIMLLWLQASHHNAPLPNLFVSYALAHKAPYRTATPYDENDTASAYSSKTAYDRMEKFKGMAKELKGPEYDVTTEPLDHALVMISGEGRKHGKEAIAGGMFPSSSHSSLPEYKARLRISKSSTYKRLTPAMVEMEVFYTSPSIYVCFLLTVGLKMRLPCHILQARLAEERRVAAEERVEERRLADERTQQAVQQAVLAQTSQCFAMFAVSSLIAKDIHELFYYQYLIFTQT